MKKKPSESEIRFFKFLVEEATKVDILHGAPTQTVDSLKAIEEMKEIINDYYKEKVMKKKAMKKKKKKKKRSEDTVKLLKLQEAVAKHIKEFKTIIENMKGDSHEEETTAS